MNFLLENVLACTSCRGPSPSQPAGQTKDGRKRIIDAECSWCYELTSHALSEEYSVYCCLSCYGCGKTTPSDKTDSGVMSRDRGLCQSNVPTVRRFPRSRGFSRSYRVFNHARAILLPDVATLVRKGSIFTSSAAGPTDFRTWQKLSDQRKNAFSWPYTVDSIKQTLARDSDYKRKAAYTGMLRPFLFLASMHPATRCQLGIDLGIALVDSDAYGDHHAEAYQLLTHPQLGILARLQVSRFSGWFGAVPKPIDYYQMLVTFASKVMVPRFLSWNEEFRAESFDSQDDMLNLSKQIGHSKIDALEWEILSKMSVKQHGLLGEDSVNSTISQLASSDTLKKVFDVIKRADRPARPLFTFVVDACFLEACAQQIKQVHETELASRVVHTFGGITDGNGKCFHDRFDLPPVRRKRWAMAAAKQVPAEGVIQKAYQVEKGPLRPIIVAFVLLFLQKANLILHDVDIADYNLT